MTGAVTALVPAVSRSPSSGVAWLAGEASGDFLASLVLPELERRMGGALQFGIGGEKMLEAGLFPWYTSDRLSVMGYVEVLKKLPSLLWLRSRMISRIKTLHPRAFIGVDAPDFNLGIETALRREGIPTVHFVSPSIWAWRPERIEKIRRAADHVLLIFPFEKTIYDQAGIPATYVGHPLAGIIPMKPDPAAARAELGLDTKGEPLFAVLPGSRVSEVSGCAPIFFQACERLLERLGAGCFVIPAVDDARRAQIENAVKKYPRIAERTTVITGKSHRVLEASDAVMTASGTAALEAALYKKPMVVGYVMPGLTAMMFRKKGLIPYVSLPNILLQSVVVPEFLQYFCTPDALACGLIHEMRPSRAAELAERFTALHDSLLRPTADLAVDAIMSVFR